MARRLARALLLAAAGAGAVAETLTAGTALGEVGQHRLSQLQEAWGRELDTARENPVKRVVAVLQKMKSELDEEAKNEAALYDKMVCWCDTNKKEKTRAVKDAEAKDVQLSSEIEARSARFGELSAEITALKEQIDSDKKALKEAISIREQTLKQAHKDQKAMVQSIRNMENAVAVMSKKFGLFVQTDKPLMAGMRVILRDAAMKYEMLMGGRAAHRRHGASFLSLGQGAKVSAEEQSATEALLSALDVHSGGVPDALPLKFAERMVERSAKEPAPAAAFLQVASSTTARGGDEILGILKAMLDDFKSELAKSQAASKKADEDGKALAAAKEKEVEAGKKKLDELQGEYAGNTKFLSDAKQDLESTRKQRAADVEFLQNLKLTCNDLDAQWEQRSKTRSAETTAVAETIAILTEDDARELTSRSTSFLQLRSSRSHEASSMMAARRARAVLALRKAAEDPDFDADDLLSAWHSRPSSLAAKAVSVVTGPRAQLSTLAMRVQLDSFDKVKEAIDMMVAQLKEQQAEEVKFKEYCNKQLKENAKALHAKEREKKDVEGKIEQLEALVDNLESEISEANKQISETQKAIAKAGEAREKENAEFQSIVSDQRATQTLLKKALARLQDFYVKGKGRALLQREEQTPPVQFGKQKDNAGASPVMSLLESIIEDSAKLEQEALAGEASAQTTYESFVLNSNKVIKELGEAVTLKSKAAAASKLEKAQAESDLESAVSELGSLSDYEDDLHTQCDWVLKNFDIRQKARLQEVEAIQAAKAILSGAK